jgi:fermentation-respiration switch protein FrsA (DUF1100 family)
VVSLLAYFGICYRFADAATRIDRHPLKRTAEYVAATHEDVTFTASDGTTLRGWWFEAPAPRARAIVFVHGRDQDRIDSSFPAGRMARTFLARGYSALLFDVYGHGESGGGPRWGLGKLEAVDVAAAVDLAAQKAGIPRSRVAVIAESLGAGSSAMSLRYIPDVGPMVLDSVYTDAHTVFVEYGPRETGLPAWFVPGMELIARGLFGLDFSEVRPIDQVKAHSERAFFFIQCANDRTVFPHHGPDMKAASANPATELWVAPDCGHVKAYSAYPAEWESRVGSFLERQLGQ